MAIKTIDFYRRITVATHTEVIFALGNTACCFACVAVDAFLEAMLLGPDAFDDCFVTVMIQHSHVVTPHVVSILYTLLTLGSFGDHRLGCDSRLGGGSRIHARPRKRGCGQDDCAQCQQTFHLASHAQSPIPITI